MGINVVLRGIITLFLIGIVFLGLMPTVNELATDPDRWGETTDSRAVFLRDNAMNIYYISGIIGMFATVVWTMNAAASKGSGYR